MSTIRRLWPFRSYANFSLSLIGVTGLGLLYYSISNQRVFSKSPVVGEAIKIMGGNDSVRNLLGHPVNYSGTFSNTYHLTEEEQYYNFQVKGSKTNTTTQLSASRIKVQDLDAKIAKVQELQNVIQSKMDQIKELGLQSAKAAKKEKSGFVEQMKNMETELAGLNIQLRQAKIDKIEAIKKYYIPDQDTYPNIMKNKNPSSPFNPSQYLYGINALTASVPNKNVINIIPAEQQLNLDKNSQKYQQMNKKYLEVDRITEGYLRDRLKVGINDLTDQELENYGRHKTMMMYGKYNGYRLGIAAVMTFALITTFLTWHIYRIRPVGGTIIAYQAERLFLNNHKVGQIIKSLKKSKNQIKFSKTFQGGRRNDNFKCSVELQGLIKGKLYFEGRQQQKGQIKFSKLVMEYKEGEQIKKVDLLV